MIDTPLNLAQRYFSRAQSGFAPFPGYVYNRRLVDCLRLPLDGGKYADVTWLLSLATKGPIVWVNLPLITYRVHEGNDGNIESLRDRLRFFGFLKQNNKLFSAGLLKDYRSFVYKMILKKPIQGHATRHSIVASFMNFYRCSRYASPDYYRALSVRVLVKLIAKI